MNKQNSSNYTETHIRVSIYGTESGVPLSHEVTIIIQWIFYAILGQIIVFLGIGANIINIICFVKQGFKDSVNVSLMGLSISDLGCLSTLIWTNICNAPAFSEADLPFDTFEVQYLTAGMPHTTFARVTACITAFITLERCLCIAAPLKVKSIFTPRRVSIIIAAIFIILLFSVAPLYFVAHLGKRFDVRRNRTILGVVYSDNSEEVENISFPINNIGVPFTAFTIIICCTLILVITLQRKTQWRKESTVSAQADNVVSRNQKVVKMVVIISTLFIVCFLPISFGFITVVLVPEFSLNGKYRNNFTAVGAFGFLMESINSSANIIVYYKMSGKYRATFNRLFKRTALNQAT